MDNISAFIKFKQNLLQTGLFRSASRNRYTCQCPFCNDNHKHMYVLFKMDDDTPLLYMCFKCNSSGIVNKEFLDYLGINDIRIPKMMKIKKKININKINQNIVLCNEKDNIDYVCNYINRKIGEYPSLQELQFFQYVTHPYEYAKEYLGYNKNDYMFKDRHWFRMTNGGLIGRHNKDNQRISWLKYVNDDNVNPSGLYTIKLPFDLYKPINVYIAEGVMDVIGLYYHYIKNNNIYIACLGKGYETGLRYLLNMGIFGNSVNIKIFKDSDVNVKDIRINPNLKKLFNDVSIYQNVIGKDYGMMAEKIEIQKCL